MFRPQLRNRGALPGGAWFLKRTSCDTAVRQGRLRGRLYSGLDHENMTKEGQCACISGVADATGVDIRAFAELSHLTESTENNTLRHTYNFHHPLDKNTSTTSQEHSAQPPSPPPKCATLLCPPSARRSLSPPSGPLSGPPAPPPQHLARVRALLPPPPHSGTRMTLSRPQLPQAQSPPAAHGKSPAVTGRDSKEHLVETVESGGFGGRAAGFWEGDWSSRAEAGGFLAGA
ncbi:hypothetical protein V493_00927 [Pseudogymnoascus sp. VKM F-4281 (FW-2241)]|nr:hypothetical protein V493_00927 [Pseudogymnoascus sp. VKM F-4281 (FW-2241)]